MENQFLSFDAIKELYPNEWVLLRNPEMVNTSIKGGIVVYHSVDKKGFVIWARTKRKAFQK